MNVRNGMRPVHPSEMLYEELDVLGLLRIPRISAGRCR